jgi:hypothetical protein
MMHLQTSCRCAELGNATFSSEYTHEATELLQELLATKAAAFSTTHDLLTVGELLVLFNHRERVLPSDPELKIILASWVQEEGPGLFWLLSAVPARVVTLSTRV